MNDLSTQLTNSGQRAREIGHGEVRQRHGVARALSSRMKAELGPAGMSLPALSFRGFPVLQTDIEQSGPEPVGTVGIVCRELDK